MWISSPLSTVWALATLSTSLVSLWHDLPCCEVILLLLLITSVNTAWPLTPESLGCSLNWEYLFCKICSALESSSSLLIAMFTLSLIAESFTDVWNGLLTNSLSLSKSRKDFDLPGVTKWSDECKWLLELWEYLLWKKLAILTTLSKPGILRNVFDFWGVGFSTALSSDKADFCGVGLGTELFKAAYISCDKNAKI